MQIDADSGILMEREQLLKLMSGGVTLLTANARLSRTLLRAYEEAASAGVASAWPTPTVLPWQIWLQQRWEDALLLAEEALPLLLDEHQASILWQQVLARHPQPVLSTSALVRQLEKSWRLLHDWRLSMDDPGFMDGGDAEVFRTLARAFSRECARRGFLTRAEMPARLAGLLAQGACALPGEILLMGFSVITPAQQALLEALRQRGVRVRIVRLKGKDARPRLLQAADPAQELALAAAWARRLLLEQPSLSLGIVVPDLQNRHDEVEDCMNRVLEPGSLLPGNRPSRVAWNISLGRPLADYPPVNAALGLLGLFHGRQPLEQVESLLRAPYVAAGETEIMPRAWLVHRLRETGRENFDLGDLLYHASARDPETGEPRPWNCPRLARCLARLQALRKETGQGARLPGQWAALFRDWLEAGEWMAETALDSADYQVVERWKRLLAEFRKLDLVAASLSPGQALKTLGRMARDSLFQPSHAPAPLQVLGLFEATELHFDRLWVMGMHETAWPVAPDPDPFIPLSLQRGLGMPGSDAARELGLARDMISGLESAANDVIFSHALMDGAEELQPTPLLDHCPRLGPEDMGLRAFDDWERQITNSGELETLNEDPAPVVQNRVRGGASLFRHQSRCPFRAFAEYRLGAGSFPSVHGGLDAAQRGSLLHRALDLFWEQTGDQRTLLSLKDEDLLARVRVCVSSALAEFEGQQPGLLGPRGRSIEDQRLQTLILNWLEKEKSRAPFRVIGREARFTGSAPGVDYRLYVDRIDELEDGRQVLLDYKTGRVSPAAWFGERPDDPQLPLYSTVLDTGNTAAVAFAQLRPDGCAFRGVVAEAGLLPGLPASRGAREVREATEDWPRVLEQWRQTMDGLAQAFSQGRAEVDPKNGITTCTASYCELMSLCRYHEQAVGGNHEA